ncbi:hypothetical protein GCM10027046_22480 [Uliginosibacterium flavum]|uniref:Outer membrane protein assembly factor BamE n=1 Tax=Uliginosibacterium flavum TaxID=1396831 RepID=A0ABV2TNW0_9RHOO
MKTSVCSLILVSAVLLNACGSKGTTQNSEAAPAAKAPAEAAPAPKPVVSCVPFKARAETPPAKTTTKAPTKSAAKKATKTPASTPATAKASPAPSGPINPNADGSCPSGYDRIVTQPEPEAAPAVNSKDDGSPRMVKSRDGSYEGEVYGRPAAGSKLAKLQIGMPQAEVEKLIGRPDDIRGHITGKAFNPFYFGSDAARVEWIYRGHGSVAFDAGHWGGGGVVMMINHDPKIQ